MPIASTLLALALSLIAFAPAATAAPGDTIRISVDDVGAQASGPSTAPSVSADGRFVAFVSGAPNLLPPGVDTNSRLDVFVHDREAKTTERVSVGDGGVQSNGNSTEPAISADGRFVAFTSFASNLGADSDLTADIFVHDRETGETEWVSVRGPGSGASGEPAISADGSVIAFRSAAGLLPGAKAPVDVFVRDREAATTERVSVNPAGEGGNGPSTGPAISADGSVIAFASAASDLVPDDENKVFDIFVRDREAGSTERVSVNFEGTDGGNAPSMSRPAVSADGSAVAFVSAASDLVAGDANNAPDVFVFERVAHALERVNVSNTGEEASGFTPTHRPALDQTGSRVAFVSGAFNLVQGRTVGPQLFVRDRQIGSTEIVSVTSGGLFEAFGGAAEPAIDAEGSVVAFASTAANLVPDSGDTNSASDVFAHERGGEPATAPAVAAIDAASGGATETTQPIAQPGVTDIEASLQSSWDPFLPGLTPPGLDPWLTQAVIHFDDDFEFDAGGLPTCEPSSLFFTTTAAAIAACPGSKVGTGSFDATLGSGTLTFFNGPPAGADPTLVVHVRLVTGTGEVTEIRRGVLRPSAAGPDFGQAMDFGVLAIGPSNLELTIEGEPQPGHRYVSARCSDADRTWNFAADLTFDYGEYAVAQVLSAEVTQECSFPDSDGDGIPDEVDDPGLPPGAFSDGEGTTGAIVDDGGLGVTVSDAPAPDGVRIVVGDGEGVAIFSVCGSQLELDAGSDAIVTCGSVVVRVLAGEARVIAGGGLVVVSVPAGGTARVSDGGAGNVVVENQGETDVLVSVDGVEQQLAPGDSTVVSEPSEADASGGGQVAGPGDGSKVVFGFTARSDSSGKQGSCNLVDPSKKTKLTCESVTSMTASGSTATFSGEATIDGELTQYTISVDDRGEPGIGKDTYSIQTASGYKAGGTLKAGNIQVR